MKRKRLLTLIGSICLILVLAALLLPACAPKVVEAPELEAEIEALEGELTSEKAEVSKLEKELAELRKPAEVFEWRMQSIFTPGSVLYDTVDELLIPRLEKLSGGRIKLTQYPAGSLCPSTEILGAVGKGMFEMGYMTSVYNVGIMPEGYLEFPLPGITSDPRKYEYFVHLFYPLLEEAYNEQGCHQFRFCMSSNWYGSIWTKPIRTIADLKGLKIRSTGLFSNAYEVFGAVPTFLTLEEIYTGLATGTVDGMAYTGPGTWMALKLHEVAKYIHYPPEGGWSYMGGAIINLDLWNSLPEDLQDIMTAVNDVYAHEFVILQTLDNEEGLRIMTEEYGCEIVPWSDEDVARWNEESYKLWDEIIAPENERCAQGVQMLKDIMNAEKHPVFNLPIRF